MKKLEFQYIRIKTKKQKKNFCFIFLFEINEQIIDIIIYQIPVSYTLFLNYNFIFGF